MELYLNYDKMTIDYKILIALSNMDEEKININSNDKCYTVDNKIDDCYDISDITTGYPAEKVENHIKEVFGKNTKIEHMTIKPYIYDITSKVYYAVGIGYGAGNIVFENINKITTKDNNLYIYVHAGSTDIYNKVCYDIDIDNSTCVELKSNSQNGEIDYQQYMKDNKDKFAKYKYTFEKEDNNYIIKGLEKID